MIPYRWKRSGFLLLLLGATLLAPILSCNHGGQVGFAPDSSWKKYSRLLRVSPDKIYAPHAAHYDSTPGHDKSGTCVHVDVCYASLGWNGYKFWMIFTPYRSAQHENPNILVSNDGRNWSVPAGLTNPIDSLENMSGRCYLSDPDLLFGKDGKLWAFYRMDDDKKKRELIFVKSSENGITWSPRDTIFDSNTESCLSPAVIAEHGRYTMWYVDARANPNRLHKRTCRTPNGAWSESTVCNIPALPALDIWHINVSKVKDQYYALVVTVPSGAKGLNARLWLAVSSDGNTWTLGKSPLLEETKATADWDGATIYRSSGIWLKKDDKTRYGLWYVGKNSLGKFHLGYTEVIFGATEGVFKDFFWVAKSPKDYITVSNPVEEQARPFSVKIENVSSQEHQLDTLIFSGVVPSDGLPKFFDSSYTKIDSLMFEFETSSSDTSVSGVRFGIFKQRSRNTDTISLYGNSKKRASETANTWRSVFVRGDSVGLVSPGDTIFFWLISNTDAHQNITTETPRLYYKKQVF